MPGLEEAVTAAAAGNSAGAYAVRVVTLAWAMSSWTKATLLLKATPPPFRFMTEDEKRYFACYHLLIAWTSLRHLRTPRIVTPSSIASLLLPDSAMTKRPSTAQLSLLTLLTVVFDEFAYNFIFLMMLGRKPTACGEFAKGALDEDCLVCRGAGVDDRALAKLEFFCDSPQHVAHRHCMNVWISSRQQNAHQCPACRKPIKIRSDFTSMTVRELLQEISWSNVLSRSLITASYVVFLRMLGVIGSRLPHDPITTDAIVPSK